MQSSQQETSRRVAGELSYPGYDRPDLEFSFDDVIRGIRSLDGQERCGLHFQLGTPSDGSAGGVIVSDWLRSDIQPIALSGPTFCVGGGAPDAYICHVYTSEGPIWLRNPNGDPNQLYEVNYDCGCDTEAGLFPGTLVVSYERLLEAARHFFFTGRMAEALSWIHRDQLDFDPWCRD